MILFRVHCILHEYAWVRTTSPHKDTISCTYVCIRAVTDQLWAGQMRDTHYMLACLSELRPFLTLLLLDPDEGEQHPMWSINLFSTCLSLCLYLFFPLLRGFTPSLSVLSLLQSLSLLLCLPVSSSLRLKSSQTPQQHMQSEAEQVAHRD